MDMRGGLAAEVLLVAASSGRCTIMRSMLESSEWTSIPLATSALPPSPIPSP